MKLAMPRQDPGLTNGLLVTAMAPGARPLHQLLYLLLQNNPAPKVYVPHFTNEEVRVKGSHVAFPGPSVM